MDDIRKVFQVMVNDKPYWVWNIDGKKHPHDNGASVKTWWLYYSDDLPGDAIPPLDSEAWHPYYDNDWFPRHCWDISIRQRTTTKVKWDETSFSNHTAVELRCNGKLFFSFGTSGGDRGLHFAWNKAMYMMTMLSEHPFNFYQPEKENGRKIWFYNLPAIILTRESTPWEISICPDFEEFQASQKLETIDDAKKAWMEEYVRRRTKLGKKPDPSTNFDEVDKMYEDGFNSDLFKGRLNWGSAFDDGNINWFRK